MKKLNRISILLLIFSIVMFAIPVTYAAYTSLSSAKRVVKVSGGVQYFSSNVLEYKSTATTRVVSFENNEGDKEIHFNVSNFVKGDSSKFYNQTLTYKIEINITDTDGNTIKDADILDKFSLVKGSTTVKLSTSNPLVLENQTLMGGKASTDNYVVLMKGMSLDTLANYKIIATASSTDPSNYKALTREFIFTEGTSSSGWVGSFIDSEKNAVENGETLDMISYRLSGHSEQKCILSWNCERVTLDSFFYEKMKNAKYAGEITQKDNIQQVQLTLGAADTPDQYLLTFYRTISANGLNETWDTIKSYVSLTAIDE